MKAHPDWDLRIFYENIKTIYFDVVDDDYFIDLGEKTIGGRYNGELNQIILPKDFNDDTFYHELAHVFDIYFREYDDKIICRGPSALKEVTVNEAMTNEMMICMAQNSGYDKFNAVLNYFGNYVDFDYYDYNNKGISVLESKLKDKYPDVNVEDILTSLDTLELVSRNENQYIYLDQSKYLLDELFKICIIELSKETENDYAPFAEFAKLLYYTSDIRVDKNDNYCCADIMYKYLDKYNKLLERMGYSGYLITKEDILKKVDKYKNVTEFFYKEDSVLPVVDSFFEENEEGYSDLYITTIQEDGSKKELLSNDYNRVPHLTPSIYFYMQIKGVEYYDIIGTPEYWKKIALDYGSLSIADLESIPIYWDGEFLTTELIDNLEVTVGRDNNGKLAFGIKSKDTNFFYSSGELNETQSKYVPLKTYLKHYNPADMTCLELSNVFNKNYLMDVLLEDCFFTNIIIQDNDFVFIPTINIVARRTIDDIWNCDLGEIFFCTEHDKVKISPLNYVTGLEEKVYLKDILVYYDVLDEDIFKYEFTEDELMNYYENYMKDMNRENNNSMGL